MGHCFVVIKINLISTRNPREFNLYIEKKIINKYFGFAAGFIIILIDFILRIYFYL